MKRFEYQRFNINTDDLVTELDIIGTKRWEVFQIEEIKAPNPATPTPWYWVYAKREYQE